MKMSFNILLFLISANIFNSIVAMQPEFGTHPAENLRRSDPIEISQKALFSRDLTYRKPKLKKRISNAIGELDREEMRKLVVILQEYLDSITDLNDELRHWLVTNIEALEVEIHRKIDDPVNYLTKSMINCRDIGEEVKNLKEKRAEIQKKTKNLLTTAGTLAQKIEEKEQLVKKMESENIKPDAINIEKNRIEELKETKAALIGLSKEVKQEEDNKANEKTSCTIV